MSLKDTIEGARAEAAANRTTNVGVRKRGTSEKDIVDELTENDATASRQGFSKKSVTRAKPSREAAAGVYVASSSKPKAQTKEERKEQRRAERTQQDRVDSASRLLLENDENYKPYRRVWWILLGVGFAALVVSMAVLYLVSDASSNPTQGMGLVSVVFTVLAYIFIIAAFIWDWRKIRPLRKKYDALAGSMTRKKIKQTLAEGNKK